MADIGPGAGADPSALPLRLRDLSTAHVADGCQRLGLAVRCAPPGLVPVLPGSRTTGWALPAQHAGSVDVFLEALEQARPGQVLVVDNGGRLDEACVGDLVALEAARAGLAGLVIWGLHRDTAELRAIGLPVHSLGALPSGPAAMRPRAADALDAARIGDHVVTAADVVHADDDGVVLVPGEHLLRIAEAATAIRDTERRQAAAMVAGTTLRQQTRFAEYLVAREARGTGFREHLRDVGGAVEE